MKPEEKKKSSAAPSPVDVEGKRVAPSKRMASKDPKESNIRVSIVEDNARVRGGLEKLLAVSPG